MDHSFDGNYAKTHRLHRVVMSLCPLWPLLGRMRGAHDTQHTFANESLLVMHKGWKNLGVWIVLYQLQTKEISAQPRDRSYVGACNPLGAVSVHLMNAFKEVKPIQKL